MRGMGVMGWMESITTHTLSKGLKKPLASGLFAAFYRPRGCSCRAVGLDLQSRPIEYKDLQSAKAMY